MHSYLHALDKTKADLQKQFSGWHIWYVPGMNRTVTWCAQPYPLLNTDSPEHLAAAISEAHEVAACEWPALANRVDYAVTAPAVNQPDPAW